MKKYQKTDLAYVAGLLDGEGYIGVFVSKRRLKRSPQFSTRIAIINTDRSVLEWLCSLFGGAIQEKVRTAENSKQCWEWQVCGGPSDVFAKLVFPYLRIKRKQAKIYLDMRIRQKTYIRNRKFLPHREVRERNALILRMRILNKQGAS